MLRTSPQTPAHKPNRPRLNVGFILLPHFTLTAFSTIVDILRLAADEGDRSRPMRCSWTILGATLNPVPASCGIEIAPWQTYGDPSLYDYVIVIGGLLHRGPTADHATIAFLQEADRRGVTLAGICTGSFTLAKAGLLEGRKCCVSWYHYPDLIEQTEGLIPVADQLFVQDGRIITCAGGTSSLDLGAWIVERHLGAAVAQKSLHILLADGARAANAAQPQPASLGSLHDEEVRRAVLLIEQSLSAPPRVEDVARAVGLSARQLERRFKAATGQSLQEFSRRLRTYYALWLMTHSDKSIAAVASESGFADSSHFNRSCRATFGDAPSAMRRLPPDAIRALLDGRGAGVAGLRSRGEPPLLAATFLARERRPYLA